jgi:hypothetical protein
MIRVPVPFVECRACGSRAVQVLYQTVANASKRAAGADSQARENRSDNFFTFVTERTHGTIPDPRGGA